MFKVFAAAFFALAIAVGSGTTARTQEATASLRLVHASPDAPAVDIYVDGVRVLESFDYTQGTGYLTVPAGERRVAITAADAPGTVVFEAPVTLDGGRSYTVVATGLLAGEPGFAPLVLTDRTEQPAAGKARVRFVHASPGTPAVDIALAGGSVVFADVAYREDGELEVDAGTYDLEARVAGTETVALSVPGVTLEEGKVYTIFAIGQIGGANELRVLTLVYATPVQ
jgi:hypothetical protein